MKKEKYIKKLQHSLYISGNFSFQIVKMKLFLPSPRKKFLFESLINSSKSFYFIYLANSMLTAISKNNVFTRLTKNNNICCARKTEKQYKKLFFVPLCRVDRYYYIIYINISWKVCRFFCAKDICEP